MRDAWTAGGEGTRTCFTIEGDMCIGGCGCTSLREIVEKDNG